MAKIAQGKGNTPKPAYPLTLKGELEEPLSRWLMVVAAHHPHAIRFCFPDRRLRHDHRSLFSILFTGHPCPVQLRGRAALELAVSPATGRWPRTHPPFSLRQTDYPADLEVEWRE
jgi:hypothetical protein